VGESVHKTIEDELHFNWNEYILSVSFSSVNDMNIVSNIDSDIYVISIDKK